MTNQTRAIIQAGTFTELHTEFNGIEVELVKWITDDIARVRTDGGTELDLRADEIKEL